MNNHIITAERVRPKKPYTPQFSTPAAIAVRRLAWAMDRNMIQAIDRIIQLLPAMFDSFEVCLRCKDRSKCDVCVFNHILSEQQKAKLTNL
jgi:hypothetical protein